MYLDNFDGISDTVWANIFGMDVSAITLMRADQRAGFQFIRVF